MLKIAHKLQDAHQDALDLAFIAKNDLYFKQYESNYSNNDDAYVSNYDNNKEIHDGNRVS